MTDRVPTPPSPTSEKQGTPVENVKYLYLGAASSTLLLHLQTFLSSVVAAGQNVTEGSRVAIWPDTSASPYQARITYASPLTYEYESEAWRQTAFLSDIANLLDEAHEFLELYYGTTEIELGLPGTTETHALVSELLERAPIGSLPDQRLVRFAQVNGPLISEDALFQNRHRLWEVANQLLFVANGLVALLQPAQPPKEEEPPEDTVAEKQPTTAKVVVPPPHQEPPELDFELPEGKETAGELEPGIAEIQTKYAYQAAWLQGTIEFSYFTTQGIANVDPALRAQISKMILSELGSLSPAESQALLRYPDVGLRLKLMGRVQQKLLQTPQFRENYLSFLGTSLEAQGKQIEPAQLEAVVEKMAVEAPKPRPLPQLLVQAIKSQEPNPATAAVPETFAATAEDTIDSLIVAEGDIDSFLKVYNPKELEVVFFGKPVNLQNQAAFQRLIRQYYLVRKDEHQAFLNRQIKDPIKVRAAEEAVSGVTKARQLNRVSTMRQAFQGFRAKGYDNKETMGAITAPMGIAAAKPLPEPTPESGGTPKIPQSISERKIQSLKYSLLQGFAQSLNANERQTAFGSYQGYNDPTFQAVPPEMAYIDVLRGEFGAGTHLGLPAGQTAPPPALPAPRTPGNQLTAPKTSDALARGVTAASQLTNTGKKVLSGLANNALVDKGFDFVLARAIDAALPGAGTIVVTAVKMLSPQLWELIKKIIIVLAGFAAFMSALLAATLAAPFILAVQFGSTLLGAIGGGLGGIATGIGNFLGGVVDFGRNLLGIGDGGASAAGTGSAAGGAGSAGGGAGAGGTASGAGGAGAAGGSGWSIAGMTGPWAAAGITVGMSGFAMIVITTTIYSSFLYPLPTITDNEVSPYVDIQKVAIQGTEFDNPTDITYTIRVKAKSGFRLQPSPTKPPTDVFSVVSSNSSSSTVPASSEYQAFLATLATFAAVNPSINDGTWVDIGSYTIPFGSDPTSANFKDSNVTNTFTMYFTVTSSDGRPIPGISGEIEAFSAEVICFGNCPQNQGGCWPTTGYISQRPFSDGAPPNTLRSHLTADAYDIANSAGTKVYTPWDGRALGNWDDAFGNYVKLERSTPAGSKEYFYFGHMNEAPLNLSANWSSATAGQHIGYIGSTGNSTGPHLHYEVSTSNGANNSNLTFDTSILRQRVPQPNVTITSPGNFVRSCYD